MGFKEERQRLLDALCDIQAGRRTLQHDQRDVEDNHLLSGARSLEDVMDMVKASSGRLYEDLGPHHNGCGAIVHSIAGVKWQGRGWYLKWYYPEPDLCFISVHPTRVAR